MPFARSIIGPDERLIMVCRLHWIYIVQGLFWFLSLTVGGFYVDARMWENFGDAIPAYSREVFGFYLTFWTSPFKWLFTLAGFVFFVLYLLKVVASEIALTTRRIIYKHGLIFVELEEIELDEIKGERIHHGYLGWLLGYGTVFLDCRFIGDTLLPAIRKPYRFLKAAHQARSKLGDSFAYAMPIQPPPAQVLQKAWTRPIEAPSPAPPPDEGPEPALAAPRRRRRKAEG